MATKKFNNPHKQLPSASANNVPECPVCKETMCAPIYQCKMGHSLCNYCTKRLMPPLCPICREDMTQMRNWQLEELVSKVPVPCPNKSAGCVYTLTAGEVEDHLKECIFRVMDCPLAVFGKCSWNGQLREMMLHFKDRHPSHCDISPDDDVTVTDASVKEDERFVYLVNLGRLLFIITVKIDTLQKMSYWTIQHIGSKKAAQQHLYEFHITSQLDNRRKVVFADHCFNDNMKTEEIFRLGKCGMLPLDGLANFIKNKTMKFRFLIKKNTFVPKGKNYQNEHNEGKAKPNNNPNFHHKGAKGPGPNRGRNTSQLSQDSQAPMQSGSQPQAVLQPSTPILRQLTQDKATMQSGSQPQIVSHSSASVMQQDKATMQGGSQPQAAVLQPSAPDVRQLSQEQAPMQSSSQPQAVLQLHAPGVRQLSQEQAPMQSGSQPQAVSQPSAPVVRQLSQDRQARMQSGSPYTPLYPQLTQQRQTPMHSGSQPQVVLHPRAPRVPPVIRKKQDDNCSCM